MPWLLVCVPAGLSGAELHVGPGFAWDDPAAAVAAARPGDVVVVHPRPGNAPYRGVALRVRQPGLVLRGVAGPGLHIPLSGADARLSGEGPHPRAVVQFDPGADGALLEGFCLQDARNSDGNAAGVRVTGAREVVIRDCVIRDNDMGIMSDGGGVSDGARGLRIERCVITGNGSERNAGYSHNLYLGGEEAVVIGCRISHARTGHNLKSRAHRTLVLGCGLFEAAERELDLVDAAGWTTREGSDAWIAGCVIVKARNTAGNRGVIHFGRDGGHDRTGQLRLVYCTIVTPYAAPVVLLSSPGASAWLEGNVFGDAGAFVGARRLGMAQGGALEGALRGRNNWVAADYAALLPPGLSGTCTGGPGQTHAWRDPDRWDYRPARPVPGITDSGDECAGALAVVDGLHLVEFVPPVGWRLRPCDGRLDLGAFEMSIEP
ncbi:hypothetical protein G4L39_06315 [Limisphaera ngatamarikiensis]|uniref:Uncharacterized protein n=1 Tax=Limisphaera ngatamarikiensis TaxID=1324935 RepID=A0A6M1S0V6_9BACT|nr:right-handed parallel beta-helix repeat-containing protein [Limisphaera ngatamarikiensis]NGO39010.1 hypothetical protein [Limisphaera ngatamarikiensis]